jgi:phytoene dehydrogenase-like protein
LLAAVDAIAATTSGLRSDLLPASEYIQITLDGREAGQEFAMPVGGVRAIIQALTKALRQAGGALFVRSPVARILLEQEQAVGIQLADGRQIRSRVVLHNGGPAQFVKLVGQENLPTSYLERLSDLKGVECAALFCATREPLFAEAPMTMTPNCRRIVGIFAPTLLDPALSKEGLYLFDAFFPTYSQDRTAELELALADMRDLFPHFDEVVAWTVPMFFTGGWPGTESGQTFGQTGENRLDPATPLKNCFLVGMDVKGSGIAGDLIPLGVQRALAYLQEMEL